LPTDIGCPGQSSEQFGSRKTHAERIRREIETRRNKALPAYTVSLGLSVAQGDAGQAADMEALIAEADAVLYRAK